MNNEAVAANVCKLLGRVMILKDEFGAQKVDRNLKTAFNY